jgi:membrane-associated phospholipid phosphatase
MLTGRKSNIIVPNRTGLLIIAFIMLTDNLWASPDSVSTSYHKPFLRQAAPYAILAAAGGLVFPLDKEINRQFYAKGIHSPGADQASKVFNQLGMAGPYAVAIPLLVGQGLIFKNTKSLYVAGELAGGAVAAGVAVEVFKVTFGRERPYQTSSPFRFFKGGSSFFSGHTISAFTFATVISHNYPCQNLGFMGINRPIPLAPVLAYTAAGLVGIQRLYSHDHWASDVYYGALAGYGVGSLAVYLGDKVQARKLRLSLREPGVLQVVYGFN